MAGNSFHFEFDSVLQQRDRKVEIAQEAMGRAIRARLVQESSLAAARDALETLLAGDAEGLGIAARTLLGAAAHRSAAADAVDAAAKQLRLLSDAEGHTRRSLAEALRAREALRTLRESAENEHRTSADRAETEMMDDLAMARAAARSMAAA